MHRMALVLLAGATGCLLAPALLAQPEKNDAKPAAKTRSFLFSYAGRVTGLEPGETARVWLPMATSNGQQEVTVRSQQLPGAATVAKDKEYGNTILSFEAKANQRGEVPFRVVYKVVRHEARGRVQGMLHLQPATDEKIERFLQPDAKVPITGKPLEVLHASLMGEALPKDPFAAAHTMYDVVNKYMTYKK